MTRRGDEGTTTLGVLGWRGPAGPRTRRGAALFAGWDLVPGGSFGHSAKLGVVEGLDVPAGIR